jgi:hypothetical protein
VDKRKHGAMDCTKKQENAMPASDYIRDSVKSALVKDGWTITDDPYWISFEDVTLFADLAAERVAYTVRTSRLVS